MCKLHGNMSSELRSWLVKNNINPEGVLSNSPEDEKMHFRSNDEVNNMEDDVFAIENIMKRKTSTNDGGSSANNLDYCRSADDDDSRNKPLATDEDVPDAEVLVDDSEKIGGNNLDNAVNTLVENSRGKNDG